MVFPSPLQVDGVWQWESRRGGPETGFIKEQASLEESLAYIGMTSRRVGSGHRPTRPVRRRGVRPANAQASFPAASSPQSCLFHGKVLLLMEILRHTDPEATKERLDPAQ